MAAAFLLHFIAMEFIATYCHLLHFIALLP